MSRNFRFLNRFAAPAIGLAAAALFSGCKVETQSEPIPNAEGGGKKVDISIRVPSEEKMKEAGRAVIAATTETGKVLGAGLKKAIDVTSEPVKQP